MKLTNETHIEGLLYEHKLTRKTAGEKAANPGVEFINGEISIATNNERTNVVKVHFSYVTANTKNGKPNTTFNVLSNIIDGKIDSIMEHGVENAGMLRVDSAIGLNEWYDKEDKLVSQKRNEGGFVHQVTSLCEEENNRNTFKVDIVITSCNRVEADPDRDTPEKMIVKGAVFDFRGALLPVELTVLAPKAMDYFESLDASNKEPVFTKVWGKQVSQSIVKKTVEESAFGDDSVTETVTSYRDFVITGAAKETYEWDSEDTMTAAQLKEKVAEREITLASIKQRQEEYQASKAANTPNGKATTNESGYNF